MLEGHTGEVSSASFSPDGTRIVTAGCDAVDDFGFCVAGGARLWDGDGNFLTALEGPIEWVKSASFSPDGTRIVTVSRDDGPARLWDTSNGNLVTALEGATGEVSSASFSPDGTRVVTVSRYDTAARLWDARGGNVLAVLEGHTGWLSAASFSADGTRIVTASRDGTARMWDASNGSYLFALQGHTHALNSASFSPDGTRIVTTSSAADNRPVSVMWLGLGLLLGLLGGLRTGVRETKTSPNQGIRLSARHAVVIGLIGGLIVAAAVGLTFVVVYALTPQPTDRFSDLAVLLSVSSLWLGIAIACWYGGFDVVQHLILRLILYFKGHIPWNYARFLEYAAERILLRKVDGGYVFIHRLLREYFAGLNGPLSREG